MSAAARTRRPRGTNLAWQELRAHPTRLAAVLLAVVISVAFISAALVFVQTETQAAGRSATASTSRADAVVELGIEPKQIGAAWQLLRTTSGAGVVEPSWTTYASATTPAGSAAMAVQTVPQSPLLQWDTLQSGRWPTRAGEAAVSAKTAKRQQLNVGDTFSVSAYGTGKGALTVTVVGITTDTETVMTGGADTAFLTVADLADHPRPAGAPAYLVIAKPGVSDDDLVTALKGVVAQSPYAAHASIRTADQVAHDRLSTITKGFDVYRNLLLVFGAIALLVGSIIIANTFTILVAQRRRLIGLLRAIGASTGQVRRSFLAEAVIIGTGGSLVGAGLGFGVAALAAGLSGSLRWGLAVNWSQLGLTVLVGIAVTVLAALAPSARAMKIKPLEALRPSSPAVARRSTVVQAVVAGLLVVAGGVLASASVIPDLKSRDLQSLTLPLAVGGAFLLAVGILFGARFFVPPLLRLFGLVAGRFGATPRLAVRNAVRNPGRAAATCTALMLAVGLIVTLQVGAASTMATMNRQLDVSYPVDLTVTDNTGQPIDTSLRNEIAAIPGVGASQVIKQTSANSGQYAITVSGLTQDSPVVAAGLGQLDDHHILLSPATAKILDVTAGSPLIVSTDHTRADHTQETLAVALSKAAGDFSGLVTPSTLDRLDPSAAASSLWISVPDRSKAGDVVSQVQRLVGTGSALSLSGSLPQSAQLQQVLDALLTIATALLAVAVAIALIGVGNTLGLSVLERTRESALLRALGLQRGQLRGMLAVEAVLLALVGAAVGIGAGIGFGYLGTVAMVRQMGLGATVLRISWSQTAIVVGVAIVAGLLASVLPARRAVRSTPTDALAEV